MLDLFLLSVAAQAVRKPRPDAAAAAACPAPTLCRVQSERYGVPQARGMVYLRQEVWCTSGPPCGGKCCEGYYLRRTPSMSSSAGCSVFTVLGHRKQPLEDVYMYPLQISHKLPGFGLGEEMIAF